MHRYLLVLAACGGPTFTTPAETLPVTLATTPAAYAVAIVRIPAPWYAPRFVIRRRFRAAVGDYEHVPGLVRKYFTISERGEFGGIYLWSSRAAANAFYSPAWRARVHERYGADADVVVLDAPFIVDGATKLAAERIDDHATSFPAHATLVLDGSDLHAFAAHHGIPPGLVRAYFVVAPDGRAGAIDLWATDELAGAALARLGGDATRFQAPVVVEGADTACTLPNRRQFGCPQIETSLPSGSTK
jgi:hypothetical protein